MNHRQYRQLKTYSAASAFPIIPPTTESQLLATLYQLELSQWWTPEQLRESQFDQLRLLCTHADKEIPFYRQRFQQAGIGDLSRLTAEDWQRMPILTRSDFQGKEALISTAKIPAPYQVTGSITTSGSTGQPIRVSTTNLTQFLWNAFTLREHQWHDLDFSQKFAAIRFLNQKEAAYPSGAILSDWGPPTTLLYRTGPCSALDSRTTTLQQQWEWLTREQPAYLLTYPSILNELIKHSVETKQPAPKFRQIRLFGETVDDALLTLCRETWNVPVTDTYSANEAGPIAHQCPEHPHYHVQAENLLVEILNEQGQPCAPGEVGRVVLTTLHNFATPLIRYAIGDYAEAGPACPCGRGLPVIRRILGRVRNILTLPNGEKRWPSLGGGRLTRIAPVTQYQVIQKTLHHIEAHLVVREKVTAEQEKQMCEVFADIFGNCFEFTFFYPDSIERSPTGKFEDFKSDLP
jgi:phenylacetate-CoA ligase